MPAGAGDRIIGSLNCILETIQSLNNTMKEKKLEDRLYKRISDLTFQDNEWKREEPNEHFHTA